MLKIEVLLFIVFIFLFPKVVDCHVFPDHSSPKVGAKVNKAPKEIKIWFDGKLEAAFSKIWVTTKDSAKVDKNDSHIDKLNPVLMEVSLKDLMPGKYHVYWKAVGRDGHHSQGDYFFTYKKSETTVK